MGILIADARFPCPYVKATGASKPGTNRLKEFVLGLVNAVRAEPCLRMPPIKYFPNSLIFPYSPFL